MNETEGYFSSASVGTPLQTGSNISFTSTEIWTLFASSDCATCPLPWFDQSLSTTFVPDSTAAVESFNDHFIHGDCSVAEEKICLNSTLANSCVA